MSSLSDERINKSKDDQWNALIVTQDLWELHPTEESELEESLGQKALKKVPELYLSEQLLKVYLAPGKVVAFERGAVRAILNVRQKPANKSPLLHHQSHQWNKLLQTNDS